jgi:hypothetical protein
MSSGSEVARTQATSPAIKVKTRRNVLDRDRP